MPKGLMDSEIPSSVDLFQHSILSAAEDNNMIFVKASKPKISRQMTEEDYGTYSSMKKQAMTFKGVDKDKYKLLNKQAKTYKKKKRIQ